MEEKKEATFQPGEKGFAVFLLIFGAYSFYESMKLYQASPGASSYGAVPLFVSALIVLFFLAINNSLFDIFWMLGFGILGYFLKRFDYPVAPCVLGIILTRLLEENYRRGVMLNKSVGGLFVSIFESPISLILFVLIVVMFATQTKTYKNWKAKRQADGNG